MNMRTIFGRQNTKLHSILPEILLGIFALLFFLRELGTFPAAWTDEGLFVIVAKMVAAGHGYALPLLNYTWDYPYFLAVGPTLILPSALAIKLFGLSFVSARIPMALYLIGTTIAFYFLARRIGGREQALWSTAMLVTLSAFVNTGKTVIGEIPAFFYLLLGLLALEMIEQPYKRSIVAGIAFGLAILTKLSFGIILAGLGIVWLVALFRRRWLDLRSTTLAIVIALGIYWPWHLLEIAHMPGGNFSQEILQSISMSSDSNLSNLHYLRENFAALLRLPYYAFALFFLFGGIGLWQKRKQLRPTTLTLIASLIGLFILYFLSSFGWYRHLLPAHLLLILFIPAGTFALLKRKIGIPVLVCILAAQFFWQLDHKGSSTSTGGIDAADYVLQNFQDRDLLIDQTEVFARLPDNPHWHFLMPNISETFPKEYNTPSGALACAPLLQKMNEEDLKTYAGRLVPISGSYYILNPPANCGAAKAIGA